MYTIYVTPALVLEKRGLGEAGNSVYLLTQDLGLVRASARGARKEESKLRYGLESLTLGRFSLVRGKHEWRLTGVEQVSHLKPLAVVGRISKLLLRLLPGEEHTPKLFETVKEGFAFIAAAENEHDREAIECVLVLRILATLGYLPQRTELVPFVEDSLFSLELASQAAKSRSFLIKAINESLNATEL